MTSASVRWVLIFSLITFVSLEPHQRSGLRIVHKLVGGHLNTNRDDDVELMTSGAGEGQGKSKKTGGEEKKTLSQQVADGKYALIQNELFSKPIKRPGIISYKDNPEVPNDNSNNLGGLNKSDIWLSENHLLVIKGGFYPDHDQDNKDVIWTPIDDFNAPDRQVKIPAHPKVPPPFPVQLEEGGPILLFLSPNVTKTLNGTFKEGIYPLYPESNEVIGGEGIKERPSSGKHPPYTFTGETPFPIPPFPPPTGLDGHNPIQQKEGIPGNVNDSLIPSYLPPFIPNLDNETYDEDDPSIYYPPPYSFYYARDNSTEVPPGPLVPGIILPPPPNFFESLNENGGARTKSKPPLRPITTTTPKPTITITTTLKQRIKTKIYFYPTNTTVNPTVSGRKKPTTTETTSRKKYPTITILKPVSRTTSTIKPKTSKLPSKMFGPPITSETPKVIVTSTKVPLKTYYATTHLEPIIPITERPRQQQFIDVTKSKIIPQVQNVEVNVPNQDSQKSNVIQVIPRQQVRPVQNVLEPSTTTRATPVQYYFYDENVINTTPRPFINTIPKEVLIPERPQPPVPSRNVPPQSNIRYYYVGESEFPSRTQPVQIKRPQRPQNSFSVHIARLKQEIESYQNIRNGDYGIVNNDRNRPSGYFERSKPVYEYEFQAAGYRQQNNFNNGYLPIQQKRPLPHYSVEIQEAVEVTPPTPIYETTQEGYYLDPVTENPAKLREVQRNKHRTSKPISQYSFEATQNPLYNQFYTKHDEKFIDDATKEYFTVFGKRIPLATTPIPIQRQKYYQRPQEVKQNRPSLEGDTYINYLPQRPRVNPHSEFILQPVNEDQNYRIQQTERPIVTYKLPGDEGTHFYFLTPQLAQKREQNANFYFSNTKNGRR
nr:uncharacterized protein LOC111427739 [Onthophagus taurus]XP_022918768.1 uncharacterized protein LOC111427739 [Onthophagus taurus]